MLDPNSTKLKALTICQAGMAILCMLSTHIFVRVYQSCEGAVVHGLYKFLSSNLWTPMLIPVLWAAAVQALKAKRINSIYTMYSGLILLALLVVFAIVTFTKIVLALDSMPIAK